MAKDKVITSKKNIHRFSQSMRNISFQGSFIKDVYINKLGYNNEYTPVRANFVELDHDDYNALKEISKKWENSKSGMTIPVIESTLLPPDVMKTKWAHWLPLTKDLAQQDVLPFLSSKTLGSHNYVITTQNDNLKKINPNDVLGLVQLTNTQDICDIATLHVRPDCITERYGNQFSYVLKRAFYKLFGINDNKNKRPYANVGDAIITTIQKMYGDKKLTLIPLDAAITFYEKHGFKKPNIGDIEYVWESKKLNQ